MRLSAAVLALCRLAQAGDASTQQQPPHHAQHPTPARQLRQQPQQQQKQAWSYVVEVDGTVCDATGRDGSLPPFSGSPATVLNAAIRALPHSGGTIFLTAGTFVLDSTVVIDRSSVEIRGENMGGVCRHPPPAARPRRRRRAPRGPRLPLVRRVHGLVPSLAPHEVLDL
eukprot:COSAG04_NODE_10081_length_805_cov_2.713881_1_plen_168_part_01